MLWQSVRQLVNDMHPKEALGQVNGSHQGAKARAVRSRWPIEQRLAPEKFSQHLLVFQPPRDLPMDCGPFFLAPPCRRDAL